VGTPLPRVPLGVLVPLFDFCMMSSHWKN